MSIQRGITLISLLARNFLKSGNGGVNLKITKFLICIGAMGGGFNCNLDIQ